MYRWYEPCSRTNSVPDTNVRPALWRWPVAGLEPLALEAVAHWPAAVAEHVTRAPARPGALVVAMRL